LNKQKKQCNKEKRDISILVYLHMEIEYKPFHNIISIEMNESVHWNFQIGQLTEKE
jgi:hypothetical protein